MATLNNDEVDHANESDPLLPQSIEMKKKGVDELSSASDVAAASDEIKIEATKDTDTSQETSIVSPDSSNFLLDDIPEPIKVLDDIISEFEDSAKPIVASTVENQSEDDGYMSLSRKNMRKTDSEEASQTSLNRPISESFSQKAINEFSNQNGMIAKISDTNCEKSEINEVNGAIVQSTLPKAKSTTTSATTNYSSLPCCGAKSNLIDNKNRIGSLNGERNILGIDISAVHKAVLRGGVAKLPEPILNEHPITIYPGLPDNRGSNRPHRLISSVQKHKEMCHILNPVSSKSSSSSSSASSPHNTDSSNAKPPVLLPIKTPTEIHNIKKTNKILALNNKQIPSESEDDFSDDSIEDGRIVLEERIVRAAPVAVIQSQKPYSIAWEIHFDNDRNHKPKSSLAKGNKEIHRALNQIVQDDSSVTDISLDENSSFNNDYKEFEEKLDGRVYRQSDMLGKGTFVIRRSTRRPPKAIDVFQSNPGPVSNHSTITDDNAFYDQHYVSDTAPTHSQQSRKQSVLNTKFDCQHSLDRGLTQRSSAISPRERLSLNIELQQQNSLPKSGVVLKTPSEDIIKQFKSNYNSNERIFRENAELNKSKEASLNSVDPTPGFSYKKVSDFSPELRTSSNTTTPHTDLAPTLEEDEEQYSDLSCSGPIASTSAPLKQIEHNISALLRGEISVARVGETPHAIKSLEFRPGVHKSESAKEMLLQNAFGPLPPSPPSSNPDSFDYDAMPPLPPTPSALSDHDDDKEISASKIAAKHIPKSSFLRTTSAEVHMPCNSEERSFKERVREKVSVQRHFSDDLPLPPQKSFEHLPPSVPPHRGHSANTMKSWSIDSNYKRRSPKMPNYGSGTTPTSIHDAGMPVNGTGSYSTRRLYGYGTKRGIRQSPREEHRLQTSCSLPETPIFARGCDIPRTPFRRHNESSSTISGSRTAPRSSTTQNINMGASIVGISASGTYGAGPCRQRSISHALASNEMLRLSGMPGRGWYPKQRSMRPASTENIDRLPLGRMWESAGMSGTGNSRKPLTLPPNLTPSFLNKSPRDALRRVTSLLITKKKTTKDRKNKPYNDNANNIQSAEEAHENDCATTRKDSKRETPVYNNSLPKAPKPPKKKSIFKNLWKRTKHFSLDQ